MAERVTNDMNSHDVLVIAWLQSGFWGKLAVPDCIFIYKHPKPRIQALLCINANNTRISNMVIDLLLCMMFNIIYRLQLATSDHLTQ